MSKLLTIITNPNPLLRKKSKIITADDLKTNELQELVLNMEKTMKERDGVGLAAPQVGKNIRIIVVNTKDGVLAMVNPKILKKSLLKEFGEEGCLSVPGIFGQVKRHKKLTCSYLDKNGTKKTVNAEGLFARVIQHEIDHLDGILFIDKAKDLEEIRTK
jgi:peptide deformylase